MFFDAHAHLQLPAFDADRDAVIARMQGRVTALMPGVDLETSRTSVALAARYDFLVSAVGLHPNYLDEEFDEAAFAALAEDPKVRAIGECGLDYYRNEPSEEERARQTERFLKHLELARKTGRPLIIHCRPTAGTQNAHEEMLGMLEQNPDVRAVIHFFTSTGEIAKRYLSLGCFLSFPGPVTYTDMYDASIQATPLERLLTETDSPFAAPVPYRGSRNEPAYVEAVVNKVAAVKGLSPEEISTHVLENAKQLFRID